MLAAIVLILIVLWFFGYVNIGNINIPDFPLFVLNGNVISLWDLLIFAVIVWAIGVLPSPFRQIAGVALLLWVLATLEILAITGLPSLMIIIIILGLIFSLLGA